MKKSNLTSNDIAKYLGVSQSMVSRAFNPKASISEQKRTFILEGAAKLGYKPNALARSLISNRSGLIAIALDSSSNPMYDLQARILASEVQRQGGHAILCPISNGDLDSAIQRAFEYQVDGLIVATSRLTSNIIEQCERYGVYLSFINRYIDDFKANSIGLDNSDAGKQVAEYFFEKGCSSLSFIGSEKGSMTCEERWSSFCQRAMELGLSEPVRISASFDIDSGMLAANQLVNDTNKIDAVFCANDIIAIGVIEGLKIHHHSGIRIIGVDDIPMASWPSYQLSTIKPPTDVICKSTVEDLFERISGSEEETGKYIFYKGTLVERSS
ncbi:LacI family DNA-binding transcriptional regulator [Vibrio superstes]|uniref:Transcriptional regulator n=1 Tax=Vibrio superstes NBRC 103154 TaxID=1219062 RepID=A0A511QPS2_9VIBR|nr:LacI family DNA-binding transcriptional regulator [Vibrio superstes]GEM79314.1 transcriptional regulator [Vibrio superstes NBRC 103154]